MAQPLLLVLVFGTPHAFPYSLFSQRVLGSNWGHSGVRGQKVTIKMHGGVIHPGSSISSISLFMGRPSTWALGP